jgi:hypothetical protein
VKFLHSILVEGLSSFTGIDNSYFSLRQSVVQQSSVCESYAAQINHGRSGQ